METSQHKSVHGGAVKEEKRASESNNGDEESCGEEEIVLQIRAGKRAQEDDGPASPNQNYKNSKQGLALTKVEKSSTPESESRSSSSAKRKQMDDQLGSTKAEMDEVMEENQRLKMYLDRILKDYRTLQMQYKDVIDQQEAKKCTDTEEESDELIDLSLGISSGNDRTNRDERRKTPVNENVGDDKQQGLALGLDCRFEAPKKRLSVDEPSPNHSPENSLEEVKEETQNKAIKHAMDVGGDDEISQQNPAKRARVSVRVRCDTPTMNDGCQWRKYGQKISKGNPCPRAYYRCTVAPSCPVRKQVQRCAEDMTILITTYEGTHNHPLPVSATAMASTTSAAASMLLSGSSTSGTGQGSSSTTTNANLNGLNFYLSDSSRLKPFYLPNSSISSSPSYPTITLDLTSTTTSAPSPSSHLARLGNILPPRYSTTNLNFSSLESNPLPISWTNNGMLSYGSSQPPLVNKINQTAHGNSLSFGSQPSYETLYQSRLQKAISNPSQQSLPPDTIAAATKAITSDPSFQSALAAALSSIIGSGGVTPASTLARQNSIDKTSQMNIKNINNISEAFPILSSFPSSTSNNNANKCAPSFLNKPPSSTSSQPGGSMFLSQPFPFSNSKSKSNSQGDNDRDHAA